MAKDYINQWYKEGQYWEPMWMGNNAVTKSAEPTEGAGVPGAVPRDARCKGPIESEGKRIFLEPIKAIMESPRRSYNEATLDAIMGHAFTAVGQEIRPPETDCCAIVLYVIVMGNIDGAYDGVMSARKPLDPSLVERTIYHPAIRILTNEAGKVFDILLGAEDCPVS